MMTVTDLQTLRALCKELGVPFKLRRYLIYQDALGLYVAIQRKRGLFFRPLIDLPRIITEHPHTIKAYNAVVEFNNTLSTRPSLFYKEKMYYLNAEGYVDWGLTRRGLSTFMGIIHHKELPGLPILELRDWSRDLTSHAA